MSVVPVVPVSVITRWSGVTPSSPSSLYQHQMFREWEWQLSSDTTAASMLAAAPGNSFVQNFKCVIPILILCIIFKFYPNFKSFVPNFKSFGPNFKSFVQNFKSFVPNFKSFVPNFKSFVPNFKSFMSNFLSLFLY